MDNERFRADGCQPAKTYGTGPNSRRVRSAVVPAPGSNWAICLTDLTGESPLVQSGVGQFARCLASALIVCALWLSTPAHGDDATLSFGGSPQLLRSHPSVVMTNEVVNVDIADRSVRVDCRFVFTNLGRGCKVRMGFPDEGTGSADRSDKPGFDQPGPPKELFTSFQSWVNGRPVRTHLVRSGSNGSAWHVKTVDFPGHSVLHIRDVYTHRLGGGDGSVGDRTFWADRVGYVLHTGASWHGRIGRSEIRVNFPHRRLPGTPKPIHVSRISRKNDELELNSFMPGRNDVVWKGPCVPTVTGRTLVFVRTNWRPKMRDDILLGFGYRINP